MYNNPYLHNNFFPYQQANPERLVRRGLFSSFLSGTSKINWSNLLNNTQKTLNVINQAIPVYYQVKPIYNNAKTMFRMVSALKDDDTKIDKQKKTNKAQSEKKDTSNGPVFFL